MECAGFTPILKINLKPCIICGKSTKKIYCSVSCANKDKAHKKLTKKCMDCGELILQKYTYCLDCSNKRKQTLLLKPKGEISKNRTTDQSKYCQINV